jgi:hypothetical protein
VLTVGAALVIGLVLVGQTRAGDPTNVKTLAPIGNGFDFGISKLLGALTPTSSTSTANTPVPIARPQSVSPRNTSLSNFLPKITLPSATTTHGFSVYPSQDQMPGSAYLKAFGVRRAPRVPID